LQSLTSCLTQRPNLAPLGDRDEDPKPTESTAVIPPATPVDERDHQLDEHNSANVEQFVSSVVDEPHERQIEQVSQPAEADPETIEWFYRDPSGLEQGKLSCRLQCSPSDADSFSARSIQGQANAGMVLCQLLQ
jgi:hypothetical protein